MRKKGILHFLRTKPYRLFTKHLTGMFVFILSAPSKQQKRDVCQHLRYWPFVKAFLPIDDTHMKVLVFVGNGITDNQWDFYVARSLELMNLCVRQHQSLFMMAQSNSIIPSRWFHSNTFLRPDDLLKPFCDFIDELNFSPSSEN